MKVVITGGSGLIGRALTASLARDGHEVVILSRDPGRVVGLPPGCRAEPWDGQTGRSWASLADGAGAVVNLAGESIGGGLWTAKRKRRIYDSRVSAGRAVLEAMEAVEQKPGVLVQASAVGYYGSRGDEEVTEDTPPGSDFLARLCVDWEASTAPVEALGVRRAVIRSGLVFSNKGGLLPRMALPFRFFLGGRIGSGQQWFPWIHVEDEVRAIRFLMEQEAVGGAFNLASPNPVLQRELVATIGRVLDRPALLAVPELAPKLVLGELGESLLVSQHVLPKRLLGAGFEFQFPYLEAALRDLLAGRRD